jgi:DNA-binding CsgD family transcriptional regulator
MDKLNRTRASAPDFDALLNAVYDCALDPAQWSSLLDMLARGVHGQAAVLDALDENAQSGSVLVEHNTDPSWSEKYRQYYASINPTHNYVRKLKPFQPFTFDELIGWREFEKSPYHNEYRVPQGFGDCLTTMVENKGGRTVYISIFRAARDPLYLPAEIRLLNRVTPHIRRAVGIGTMLGQRKIEFDGLRSALNQMAFGVVILDSDGRVLFSNPEAEVLMADRVFSIDQRRTFEFTKAADSEWLRHLLNQRSDLMPRAISLEDGRRVVVKPFAVSARGSAKGAAKVFQQVGEAACVLTFTSSAASPLELGEIVGRIYRFTPSEERVFRALVAGSTLREVAESLGIGYATVRTHLLRIFAKTDTQRQSELIRLASAMQSTLG